MFKVGDKYRLVDPEKALMPNTAHGTILEVVKVGSGCGEVKGQHPEDFYYIDEIDVKEGYVVKLSSSGNNPTLGPDTREILCRAAKEIYANTGIRLEEVDFHWLDQGDGPYIHSIHIEGGA